MTRRAGRSLQTNLVWRVVAVLVAGLLALSATLVWTLAWQLQNAADDDITTALEVVADAQDNANGGPVTFNEERLSRILPPRALIAIVAADGSVRVLGSAAVDVDALPVDHPEGAVFAFTLGAKRYRGEVVQVDTIASDARTGDVIQASRLLVAIETTADRHTVRNLTIVAGGLTAIAAVALALVAHAVIRRSLAPVRDIAAAASAVAATGAPEPIPSGDPFSETQMLARAVDDALRRREAAERAIRDFVADASHELRTPLSKVQGWADLLASGQLDDDGAVAADKILGAAEELGGVVDELALLAALDVAPSRAQAEVDLGALVREVMDEARELYPDAIQTFFPDPDPEAAGVAVTGDATSLRRAVRNLVGNAVQHGGEGVEVSAALHATDSDLVLIVSDTGPGIPPESRERIFDRFFTTSAGSGRHSGLGLAIVAAVARAHEGRVEVLDSSVGATFALTLPRSKGDRKEGISPATA